MPQTAEQALRRRTSWTNKSKDIRERSNYLCAVCLDKGIARADDDIEVHHIRKLRDYPEGLLKDDNLICLCTLHHKQADNGEIDPNYLKQLAEKRDIVDYPLL